MSVDRATFYSFSSIINDLKEIKKYKLHYANVRWHFCARQMALKPAIVQLKIYKYNAWY